MRKELYDRLDFEERTMYRIEKNSIECPQVNFGMVTFGMLASLIAVAIKSHGLAIFITKITLISVIVIYTIELISSIVENSKVEKEWTKKVIDKIEKK